MNNIITEELIKLRKRLTYDEIRAKLFNDDLTSEEERIAPNIAETLDYYRKASLDLEDVSLERDAVVIAKDNLMQIIDREGVSAKHAINAHRDMQLAYLEIKSEVMRIHYNKENAKGQLDKVLAIVDRHAAREKGVGINGNAQ